MRIALFADIHANRSAFEACLAHAAGRGIDRLVLLGDHVGYGAEPEAVLDAVMRRVADGALALQGNHDRAIGDPRESMNPDARTAIDWTRTRLDATAADFLAALPLAVEDGERIYMHAGDARGRSWPYVVAADDATACLATAGAARIAFCGHVHVPAVFSVPGRGRMTAFTPIDGVPIPLLTQRRWVCVLGSVGQPRDGVPAACYALLDAARGEIAYHRVGYDVDGAARRIRAAGLPESLAARLHRGR